MPALADDVLRCLDEIAKLRSELEQTQTALDNARDQITGLRMELVDLVQANAESKEDR